MSEIQQTNQKTGIAQSASCDALHIPRASYYRQQNSHDEMTSITNEPANKLTSIEKQRVIDLLHSERFVDNTAYQVFYTLLDEGEYHCGEGLNLTLIRSSISIFPTAVLTAAENSLIIFLGSFGFVV